MKAIVPPQHPQGNHFLQISLHLIPPAASDLCKEYCLIAYVFFLELDIVLAPPCIPHLQDYSWCFP